MGNDDMDVTASSDALSPALRAQEMHILRMCKPEVTIQPPAPSLIGAAVEISGDDALYAATRLCDMGFLEFVRDKEFNQAVYRITPKGAVVLDQPRGLSAAEEPGSEGVNNTIAESGDNKGE